MAKNRKARKPAIKKSPEVMARICYQIAEGASLLSVCSKADLPDHVTVLRWINADDSFREMYDRARVNRGDTFGEKVSDIATGVLSGEIDANVGRVAGDLLKWSAARMAPRYYGDRIEQNIAVSDASADHLEAVRKLAQSATGSNVVQLRKVEGSSEG